MIVLNSETNLFHILYCLVWFYLVKLLIDKISTQKAAQDRAMISSIGQQRRLTKEVLFSRSIIFLPEFLCQSLTQFRFLPRRVVAEECLLEQTGCFIPQALQGARINDWVPESLMMMIDVDWISFQGVSSLPLEVEKALVPQLEVWRAW